jgi:hypothetical protein
VTPVGYQLVLGYSLTLDDVAFIVIGKDEHETISKLQKACQYADAWAARHCLHTLTALYQICIVD